ncbi:MAG: hypothetical protein D8M57_10900 [Candidatus Scalindua sp. AMX11]|nr:MAG: hypothetical protein DWQ00_16155 [Candidatus Scalindua sp.]NOG83733.1 hypothetical protein [Planctomycetota bacterium]RZV73868.1 MAG: hypothetical protein EX341_13245 [Candidatus Scalindua sp. SCAELEC01]TDE64825.1 MAG: hypothetical protein D8M57_10900 [Candidatus Scalindua sp. AMX11]
MEYCERCGPGLFAEPFNAISNVAFFLAAFSVWLLAQRRCGLSTGTWILIGLVIAVGTGSTLWHTFATPWAEALDRIPILLFQLAFLWRYSWQIMRFRWYPTVALLAGFLLMGFGMTLLPPILNRSLLYLPAFVLLLVLGVYHYRRSRKEPSIMLTAAGVFLFAIIFRTIDLIVCSSFPIGTHFLWHILNGLTMYLVIRSLIVNERV